MGRARNHSMKRRFLRANGWFKSDLGWSKGEGVGGFGLCGAVTYQKRLHYEEIRDRLIQARYRDKYGISYVVFSDVGKFWLHALLDETPAQIDQDGIYTVPDTVRDLIDRRILITRRIMGDTFRIIGHGGTWRYS